MHVLYVIDSLSPAGAERSLAALAPRYARRGIRLDVAYLHDRPGLQAELAAAGATLFCLDGPAGRAGWLVRTTRLVARRRPDLVHTTLFEADVAGRVAAALARRPVVSSLVNAEYGPEMRADPALRAWKVLGAQAVDAGTARLVRRFHAVSAHVAGVMARRLRIPAGRIDVVPRGRDPDELGARTPERRARARAAAEVPEGTPLLLAIARHERQKGLDVLLAALPAILREHPHARLLVAGRSGRQTDSLRSAAERLGVTGAVRFLGARPDVPDLLCAADVFVFPSRWEGLPGSVLEAMALGAPIVASDIPTVREAVGDASAARLVPPDRPEELAGAVLGTLGDPAEARRRAEAASTRFGDRFTIERVADAMVAFYERALAG